MARNVHTTGAHYALLKFPSSFTFPRVLLLSKFPPPRNILGLSCRFRVFFVCMEFPESTVFAYNKHSEMELAMFTLDSVRVACLGLPFQALQHFFCIFRATCLLSCKIYLHRLPSVIVATISHANVVPIPNGVTLGHGGSRFL